MEQFVFITSPGNTITLTLPDPITVDGDKLCQTYKIVNLSNGVIAIDGRSVSGSLPGNQFVPFNERKTECSHDMIEYIGFTERYNHCRHCGIKE